MSMSFEYQGRTLYLTDFHLDATYGGMLCGIPDTDTEKFEKNKIREVEKMWGTNRPIVVLEPDIEKYKVANQDRERFPLWKAFAWLMSTEILGEDSNRYDGSHLVLVWCLPTEQVKHPVEMVRDALEKGSVVWVEQAADFGF